MADAGTLISNQGNAGLGFSNPDIPVGYGKDLDVINRVGEQLIIANMNQNRELFQQKIRDRDRMMQAIDSGDLKIGDILEEDQPIVKEGLESLDKVWAEWAKNPNDIDTQVKYKKALRDAQDRVTQANARFIGDKSQQLEIANDTLPRKKDARAKNLQSWKKNFWGEVMPYQQSQDLDIPGSILSTGANITTEFTDPATFTKGKRTVFDYEKTLSNNVNNFLNDVNKAHDQEQLINAIQSLPRDEFEETIISINNRIKEHNEKNNLSEGQQKHVGEVKWDVDPQTGKGHIIERLPDFSAKFTLANQKPTESVSTEFDAARANFALGQERNRIAAANADTARKRANAYVAIQSKKLSKMTDDEKRVKGFWDGVVDRVTDFKGVGDVVWLGNLPEGYTFMGGVDAKGQPIKLKPKTKGDVKYYNLKYKSGQSGEPLEKDFLTNKFKEYRTSGGKLDYNNYVRTLIKSGVVDLEVVGDNGTADFNTALQSARALSNKVGAGKEEPVYSETERVTIEEE